MGIEAKSILFCSRQANLNEMIWKKGGNMIVRVRIKDDEDVSKNFWIRTSNLASVSD